MANRSPGARDRLAFLLSLVPYLLDSKRVDVADAAAHFGVEPERVRAAVRLIAVSGVPGESSQYQHNDLFDIDWDAFEEDDEIVITHLVAIDDSPRFSAREASALIAGLQYLSTLPEHSDRDVIGRLMTKLAHGSTKPPLQLAVEQSNVDETLAALRAAVSRESQVEFSYVNARNGRDVRRVDPLRLDSLDEHWYLRGWCHTRQGMRTFRLDHISKVRPIDAPITHHAREVPLSDSLFQPSEDDVTATVDIAEDFVPLIQEYVAVERPGDAGRTVVDLRMGHLPALARLIARLPGTPRVLGPAQAIAAVADWAEAALTPYTGDRTVGGDSR